jgi:hypothetical protein
MQIHSRMQIRFMPSPFARFVIAALLVTCCLGDFSAARAQETRSSSTPGQPPQHQACRADIQKFCADVPPGSGGIGRCLLAHKTDVSAPCREVLARIAAEHAGQNVPGKPR